jgi:hypothetical protein
MPIGLLEITIGGLLIAAWKKTEKKGVLTPEREKVYQAALKELHVPAELRKLADTFEAQGLAVEATMLRRRADLRGQTPEQKRARREAYDKGMASEDVAAIERLADAFESITATGSAMALRKHAEDVRVAKMRARRQEAIPTERDSELEKELGGSSVSDDSEPKPSEEEAEPIEARAEVIQNGASKAPAHRIRRQAQRANAGE